MKTILIIGGAGFIGSHLAQQLSSRNKVYIIDNLFLGSLDNLKEFSQFIKFFKLDASKKSSLNKFFIKKKIDIVFNLATKPINFSLKKAALGFYAQVDIVLNLLELQKDNKFKKLFHFSTSEVYGSGNGTMSENFRCLPETTYAAGKQSCDILINTYCRLYKLDCTIIRPSNVYGPRQYNKNKHGLKTGLIVSAIVAHIERNDLSIQGNGEQSRDYIYVKDLVKIIISNINKFKKNEIYHISSNKNLTVNKIVKTISSMFNNKIKIINTKRRLGDVDYHKLSNTKLRRISKISLTPFSEGIRETIKYYKKTI